MTPVISGIEQPDVATVNPLGMTTALTPTARASARLAVHDCLRELMTGVASDEPVTYRVPPDANVKWYAEMLTVAWAGGQFTADNINAAETQTFAETRANGTAREYWQSVRRNLASRAQALGTTVTTRVRSVYPLDYPSRGLWASAKPELANLMTGPDAITTAARRFALRANWYAEHPDQMTERRLYSVFGVANGSDRLAWQYGFRILHGA
jgi:hypothetical protein